jgi:type VI secretion system protein ImpK
MSAGAIRGKDAIGKSGSWLSAGVARLCDRSIGPGTIGSGEHCAAAMHQDIANLVYPIVAHGVRLRERLERGDALDFDDEQGSLKRLLRSGDEARRWSEFGGDEDESDKFESRRGTDSKKTPDHFYGIRYGLVCWLDELFILDSSWKQKWNERKLEVSLYGSNDRAWRFWEQARATENRPTSDALEAYFLCVMLGFRGELRENAEELHKWVSATKTHLARIQGQEWPYSLEIEPPTHVPPLTAQERFQKMILAVGACVLLLVPVVSFFIVYQFGR